MGHRCWTPRGSWRDWAPRFGRAVLASSTLLLTSSSAATEPEQSVPPPPSQDASAVFDAFADSVTKVRVIERTSGAQATIGSGFFADEHGRLVTNYHVISKAVHDPDLFRVELSGDDGGSEPVEIIAVDVVHDLAVLASTTEGRASLRVAKSRPGQGTRLYSLGYPHDLGRTIIEGTYNGLLENRLHDKIHFSGSINPGMSGGPTIDEDGKVVGVNVETQGNQVGFLVPVEPIHAILERVHEPGYAPPADFRGTIREQLWEHQNEYVDTLLDGPVETKTFGAFVLPAKMAPFLKCWGDADSDKTALHSQVSYECGTEDYVFVQEGHWAGMVNYRHHLIQSDTLDPFRFYSLYTKHFASEYNRTYDDPTRFTSYQCDTSLVDGQGGPLKVAFCMRALSGFEGLYDVFLKVALLGRNDAGAESALSLSNVSFESAQRVAERFLGAISWKPS